MKKMMWIGCLAALLSAAWVPQAPAQGSGAAAAFLGDDRGLEIELRIRIDSNGVGSVVRVVLGSRGTPIGESEVQAPPATPAGHAADDTTLGTRVRHAAAIVLGLRRAALAVAGKCCAVLDGRPYPPEE